MIPACFSATPSLAGRTPALDRIGGGGGNVGPDHASSLFRPVRHHRQKPRFLLSPPQPSGE